MRTKRILSFGVVTKVRTMEENYFLGRHSETHATAAKLLEATSWFLLNEESYTDARIAVVNSCMPVFNL